MASSKTPQATDFTRDVLGRYVCNGLDEALNSTNKSGQRPDGSPQNDARSFDIIVVGGGSFGPVFAQHLFFNDKTHSHRILVLEAGPLVLTEHVQNYPVLGLDVPGPITVDPGVPRAEMWGLPWRSDIQFGFPGLAYCIGGRSVFFGGWSPQLLDTQTATEMPTPPWPTPTDAPGNPTTVRRHKRWQRDRGDSSGGVAPDHKGAARHAAGTKRTAEAGSPAGCPGPHDFGLIAAQQVQRSTVAGRCRTIRGV